MNRPRYWRRIGAASLLFAAISALFFYPGSPTSVAGGKSVAEWLDQIARAPEEDPEAFRAIARLGCDAYPALLKALKADANPFSRFLVFISKRLPEAVSEPLSRLTGRPEDRQVAAIRAVEYMGTNDCSAPVQIELIRLLNSPKSSEASAKALLRFRGKVRPDAPRILDSLMAHSDEPWRTNQLTVLWNTVGASGDWYSAMAKSTNTTWADVGLLIGAWYAGETNRVLEVLDRSAFGFEDATDLGLGLRQAIRPWVARHLLQLIGSQTAPLVPTWVARLKGKQHLEARERTVWALGLTGAEQGTDLELEALREAVEADESLEVRRMAIRSLGNLGRRSTKVLESLLQGSDEEMIQEARQALRRMQDDP